MDEDNGYINWALGAIVAVVGALAAAVTTLWNHSETKNAKTIEILEQRCGKCEEREREIVTRYEQEMKELRHQIAKLEGELHAVRKGT